LRELTCGRVLAFYWRFKSAQG